MTEPRSAQRSMVDPRWPDPKTMGPIALLAFLDERMGISDRERMRPYVDEMRRRLRAMNRNRIIGGRLDSEARNG